MGEPLLPQALSLIPAKPPSFSLSPATELLAIAHNVGFYPVPSTLRRLALCGIMCVPNWAMRGVGHIDQAFNVALSQ